MKSRLNEGGGGVNGNWIPFVKKGVTSVDAAVVTAAAAVAIVATGDIDIRRSLSLDFTFSIDRPLGRPVPS